MPYISTERVSEIRNELKIKFPTFKFSVKRHHHSTVVVDILEAPINLLIDGDKGYHNVNHFYIADTYKDYPEIKEILLSIHAIMNKNNGVLTEDGDYGTVPNFYTDMGIGRYDKPFQIVEREVRQQPKIEAPETKPGKVQIIEYSERAIAVIGDTRPIKDKLKELGGKFNFRLSCGAGWIFRKADLERIKEALMPKEVANV